MTERFSPEILDYLKRKGKEKILHQTTVKSDRNSHIPPPPPSSSLATEETTETSELPEIPNFDIKQKETTYINKNETLSKTIDLSKIGNEVDLAQAALKYLSPYEKSKLEWLKPLPQIKSKTENKDKRESEENKENEINTRLQNTRFNFEGQIIENEEEVPVTVGLHHHGVEPERPGYTIFELLTLIRSRFAPQRVLAIETLTNIIINRGISVYYYYYFIVIYYYYYYFFF